MSTFADDRRIGPIGTAARAIGGLGALAIPIVQGRPPEVGATFVTPLDGATSI